jgi:hypothetical protein
VIQIDEEGCKTLRDIPPIKSLEIEEGRHTIVFVNERLNKRITMDIELAPGADKDIRMNMATEDFRVVGRK